MFNFFSRSFLVLWIGLPGSLSLTTPTGVEGLSAATTEQFFDVNSTSTGFGLRPLYNWASFFSNISALANHTDRRIYRLVVIGRHGQGFHNVGEAKYGTTEWDEKWSKLDGDDEITWGPDANLTATGVLQARTKYDIWTRETALGLPWPDVKYSSPLSRTLRTAELTFNLSSIDELQVLEQLRETTGVHTCDERSSRSTIIKRFPFIRLTDDFAEDDTLWTPNLRETDREVQDRAYAAFDQIMSRECETSYSSRARTEGLTKIPRVISVTSHSGFIRNLLSRLDQPAVRLPTAGVVSLVVEATCPLPESISDDTAVTPEAFENDVKRIFLIQTD